MSKESKEVKEITKYVDITNAMKSEWREKYPDAIIFECPTSSLENEDDPEEWTDTASFVLRPLEREEMRPLQAYAKKEDTVRWKKFIQKNSILGGDMDLFRENDFVERTVTKKCTDLLKVSKGRTVKL